MESEREGEREKNGEKEWMREPFTESQKAISHKIFSSVDIYL